MKRTIRESKKEDLKKELEQQVQDRKKRIESYLRFLKIDKTCL